MKSKFTQVTATHRVETAPLLLNYGSQTSSPFLRFGVRSLASAPFHRRQQSVTRLSQEHDDQALTDPDPVPHLVALYIAWQSSAASTHEFRPTGGHGNFLSERMLHPSQPHSQT